MTEKEDKGRFSGLSEKSSLERTLQAGMQGPPQLRVDERNRYLGEFRERILCVLTRKQVNEIIIYPEVEQALRDQRSALMVVHGSIGERGLAKYEKLARNSDKPVTSRLDSKFKGDTGLIVVSRVAVDIEDIHVEDRNERLLKLGLSEQLIAATGKMICKDCMDKIRKLAPEEERHYTVINRINRLLGEKCAAH